MGLIVQKFGGTSMANSDCIRCVARRVIETKLKGHQVVVVVSAQAGMTDALIQKTKELSEEPNLREMDMVLATGEQIAMGLLAIALCDLGHPAISLTSAQVGIFTDGAHTKAKIVEVSTARILEGLAANQIVIVPGFQGHTSSRDITTLGRGGSDTSAVAIAVALKADHVEIFTDVDGIYTADPRVVKEAKKINQISYSEMLEMAGSGAKVLHLRSVELAAKNHMKIHLRSTFTSAEGTLVLQEEACMEEVLVRGVAHSIDQSKITLVGLKEGSKDVSKIFTAIANAGIVVDVITQSDTSESGYAVTFTVGESEYKEALKIAKREGQHLGARNVYGEEGIARVSVIGIGMKSSSGVAAKVFRSLTDEGVAIKMITTSNINISCLVSKDDYIKAVNAIHMAFDL